MRLKSALRRGVAAAVIAGIVVSSGIPAYAARWDIANGDITVKAGDEGTNRVTQGKKENVEDTDTVITGKSEEHTVTIDTSKGNVDVTFDDLKIDVSGKKEGDGNDDGPVRESNAAVAVQGDHDATIELDGDNELKSGDYNAGLEKNGHESSGTLTIKDDKGKDGSLTAEGGDGGGAGIGGGKESTGSNITIRGGTIKAVGGSNAAGIGDGAGRATGPTDDPNPGDLYICGDAEVTAKAGSQILDAEVPAIGGKYGEVPTENLSDEEHKVTGGRLTRLNADGTVMEGMGYDYTSVPTPQPDDEDDDDVPPPAQENAPEPLPGGMVVGGFFSSRVTIHRLDPALAIESANPMPGSVEADDTGENLTPGGVVLIESAAPRSTVTTDISSLREDGVEDIFFRYEDTMTHYSVDKMADAAGEDADVELKQNREDISLRLDGETRDDLSERYQEWVPVQTPEPQEWLILTHELAKKRDDLPSLDWWLEPEREETVEQKTSEELRRELDELLKQEREMMDFQLAKKRADHPSLDWWLEPARTETPRIGLEESLKQLASRFEAIAPEEDKPRLFLLETTVPDGTKYTNLLESDLRSYADLGDDWDDLPDTQGEIKLWIPEDLEKAKLWIPEDLGHLISPSKESLSGSDGIA
ncbi:MAG: hypothetical protein ACLR9R_10855 [Faecalibacterium prausnitzii]